MTTEEFSKKLYIAGKTTRGPSFVTSSSRGKSQKNDLRNWVPHPFISRKHRSRTAIGGVAKASGTLGAYQGLSHESGKFSKDSNKKQFNQINVFNMALMNFITLWALYKEKLFYSI